LAGCGGFGPADEKPVDYEEVLRDWSDEDISGYREVVEAKEDVDLLGGYLIVELDVVTAEALVNLARERGVDPSRAASDIIRDAVSGRDQGDGGGNG
jgi:hypothetical protein